MTSPLKLAVVLAVLAFPVLEIALLIKAGSVLGFWPVLGIVIATAFLGAGVIRSRGLAVFSRLFASLEAGRSGLEPMADTLLAVTGGMLLIFPGLISDTLGALLLLPPVRAALIRTGLAKMLAGGIVRTEVYEGRFSTGARSSGTRDRRPVDDVTEHPGLHLPPTIEGDYERIDDPPARH
ncbi:MAG: FxsA family protein [Hyphomicrobium sp.]